GVTLSSVRSLRDDIRKEEGDTLDAVSKCKEVKFDPKKCSAPLDIAAIYILRSKLPALKNSFAEDIRYGIVKVNLQRAYDRYWWWSKQAWATEEYRRAQLNDEGSHIMALEEEKRKLETGDDYREGLKKAVEDTWIRPPSESRCLISPYPSAGCLSEAQITKLRESIPAR